MKKLLPLLFFGTFFLLPNSVLAGLSEQCFPTVECDAGEDYYAGSCQPHIETVAASCPAPGPGKFASFSCDYGCYEQSTPDSVECAGGVIVNGNCLTSLYLVDDGGTQKIWDGANLINIDSDSIWSLNGTNAYYNNGNVGIGTDTPTAALQVEGGSNNEALTVNVGPGGGTAIKATGNYSALLSGIAQVVSGYPVRVISAVTEVPGTRVGTFEADAAGNFIHVGSESNHDFFIVSNDTPRVTIGATGLVGVNTTTPNYTLDVAGPINLNKDLTGAALYTNGSQMLWYSGDWVTWGLDANSNFFPKRVGIGNLGTSTSQLYVYRSQANNGANSATYSTNTNTSGAGITYGSYNIGKNDGTGSGYGSFNSGQSASSTATGSYNTASSTGDGNANGSYNYGSVTKLLNLNTAYGVYASAYNASSSCGGPDCADAFGVYATTGNTVFGTGVYGEGLYFGVRALAKSGGTAGIGLMVENEQNDGLGALFTCTGNCTSAVFRDGNDASPSVFESGIVLIGSSGGSHLALDGNEIVAKSNASTAGPLYLNMDSTGDVIVNMAHNAFASSVCRSGETLGYCASLREKKKNIENLDLGLDTVMKMRPVSFDWREEKVREGMKDLGFIAEEANEISPLLGEYNDGKLTGFKYTQYTAVLTKAIQEQQEMIEELKSIVCSDYPEKTICNQ